MLPGGRWDLATVWLSYDIERALRAFLTRAN